MGTQETIAVIGNGSRVKIARATPGSKTVTIPGCYAVFGPAIVADCAITHPPFHWRTAGIETQQAAHRTEIITERSLLVDKARDDYNHKEEQKEDRHPFRVTVSPVSPDKTQQSQAVKNHSSPS
jgi:hypothetical protein